MSQITQTKDEILDSLTGFDELAISKQFGRSVGDLTGDRSMLFRALIFTVKRREKKSDDEARAFAFDLPLKDVIEFFAEESEDAGKDEASTEPRPESSPSSVS